MHHWASDKTSKAHHALQRISRQVRSCIGKLLPVLNFAAKQHSDVTCWCLVARPIMLHACELTSKAVFCVAIFRRESSALAAGPWGTELKNTLHAEL